MSHNNVPDRQLVPPTSWLHCNHVIAIHGPCINCMTGLQALACACYHWKATDLCNQLLEAGRARSAICSPGSADTTSLSAVLETISAVHSYQQASIDAAAAPAESNKAVLALSEQISKNAGAAFEALPDVATDAVSFLWQSARPLVEGAVGYNDAGAEAAAKACHAVAVKVLYHCLLLLCGTQISDCTQTTANFCVV